MKQIKHNLFLFALCLTTAVAGQDTLWIQSGNWQASGSVSMPVLRLNDSPVFEVRNALLAWTAGAPENLTVVNFDTVAHHFELTGAAWAGLDVAPGEAATGMLPDLSAGTYGFRLSGERGKWMGAQGLVAVREADPTHPEFLWNLAEWDVDRVVAAAAGEGEAGFGDYVPAYFTINEAMHPQTLQDTTAVVALNVGETALIRVHNAGAIDHVLHFHGFHVEIVSSTGHPERVGWSKDTVPVRSGESMTLELMANQPGTFPVHDHNLIAVTNAGLYPGGMLTQIQVTP